MESGRNASKTKYWGTIVYPESAPENWKELLEETHIPSLISPLHDRDTDNNGELKKPHYHVGILMRGPISQKRANDIFEPLQGTKSAEYIMSIEGYARYLAHLDSNDANKAKYDPKDIIALNGADLENLLKPNASDTYKIVGEIMMFCDDNLVHELSYLTKFAIQHRAEWFKIIVEKPYLFTQYLNSLRHSFEKQQYRISNKQKPKNTDKGGDE